MAKYFDKSELASFANFVLEANGVNAQATAENLEAWLNRDVKVDPVTPEEAVPVVTANPKSKKK